MRRSETITALVKALAGANIPSPAKKKTARVPTKNGGEYSYQYADLHDVREAYRAPLTAAGLVVVHTLAPVDGHLVLSTDLVHTSGEYVGSDYPIAAYDKPQEQGSAITYAKRYTVSALLDMVAEDDDDGAAAQSAKRKGGSERREEPALGADPPGYTLPPDAEAILKLAVEIRKYTGEDEPKIIERASEFNDKQGQRQFFRDPKAKLRNPNWLASTRKRLEKEAHELRAKSEPGAAEAAAEFTSGLETCPVCSASHPPSEPCPKARKAA